MVYIYIYSERALHSVAMLGLLPLFNCFLPSFLLINSTQPPLFTSLSLCRRVLERYSSLVLSFPKWRRKRPLSRVEPVHLPAALPLRAITQPLTDKPGSLYHNSGVTPHIQLNQWSAWLSHRQRPCCWAMANEASKINFQRLVVNENCLILAIGFHADCTRDPASICFMVWLLLVLLSVMALPRLTLSGGGRRKMRSKHRRHSPLSVVGRLSTG